MKENEEFEKEIQKDKMDIRDLISLFVSSILIVFLLYLKTKPDLRLLIFEILCGVMLALGIHLIILEISERIKDKRGKNDRKTDEKV